MISRLSVDDIVMFLQAKPEQAAFDWKVDFSLPSDEETKGELLKDISAIANASPLSYGFIFYGVDPRRPDPIVGVTNSYDDAKLQQLVTGKISPRPEFLYYEVSAGPKTVSVVQIAPSKRRPHIISVDLGKVRKGQIPIRRGSSTDGVTQQDLFEFFYGDESFWFAQVRQRMGLDAQRLQAEAAYLAELRRGAEAAEDAIYDSVGMPRPGRR